MTELDKIEHEALTCLAEAVAEEFERKRRLGYSAVIWENGRCVEISGDELRTGNVEPTK